MKKVIPPLLLLLSTVIPTISTATPPPLVSPTTGNVGANQATFILQSGGTGTGYLTLQSGSNTPCGTAAQVMAGQSATGVMAPYHGSLLLSANVAGRYTVRNLTQLSPYTLCFTADSPTGSNLNLSPVTANLTTTTIATVSTPQWVPTGNAGFSGGGATFTSLAYAPDGTPHVAYANQFNGGKATVMKYTGGAWSLVGNDGFSAGEAQYISLLFSPDGSPCIAFSDIAFGKKATVMKFDGNSWSNVGKPGFSVNEANFTSLAFAPDGTPYLAFQDFGSSNWGATVMRFINGTWSTVGSAGFSAGAAYSTSLAIAPNGIPYLAYSDFATSPPGRVTMMAYSGGVWSRVGTAGFSADYADNLSLAMAPDSTPYVAYRDQAAGFKATVMAYRNGTWSGVGGSGVSAGYAYYTSLAFAPDGTLYLAYQDGTVNKATVMKFSGVTWSGVGAAGLSAGQTQYSSLTIGPDGVPALVYQDMANGSKATMMKLKIDTVAQVVSNLNPATLGQTVTFTATVTPAAASGMISIRDGATELATIPLSGGNASYGTASLSVGPHSIVAVYSGDGGYSGSASPPLVQNISAPIPLAIAISGNGSVNSDPVGIACSGSPQSGNCIASYPPGSRVTLTETAGNSLFVGWGGDCTTCGGNLTCTVTLDSARICSASFTPSALVTIVGSQAPFSTLQAAYNAAGNGAVLKAQGVTLAENLLLNNPSIKVTISGGYEPTFTTQTGVTTVKGSVIIGNGVLVADRIAVR